MATKPEFRIKINGFYVPNIRVQKAPDGGCDLAVEDEELGWFVVDDNIGIHQSLPHFRIEYRDETAWALLPAEIKQASLDKGWNTCTSRELIGILWNAGVLT